MASGLLPRRADLIGLTGRPKSPLLSPSLEAIWRVFLAADIAGTARVETTGLVSRTSN